MLMALITGRMRRSEGGVLTPPPNVIWWRMPTLSVPVSREIARSSTVRLGK